MPGWEPAGLSGAPIIWASFCRGLVSAGPLGAHGLTERALATAAASKQAGTCGESSSSSLELLCSVAAMLTVATSRGEERRGDCEASNEREASCDAEKMGASKHGGMRLPSD